MLDPERSRCLVWESIEVVDPDRNLCLVVESSDVCDSDLCLCFGGAVKESCDPDRNLGNPGISIDMCDPDRSLNLAGEEVGEESVSENFLRPKAPVLSAEFLRDLSGLDSMECFPEDDLDSGFDSSFFSSDIGWACESVVSSVLGTFGAFSLESPTFLLFSSFAPCPDLTDR